MPVALTPDQQKRVEYYVDMLTDLALLEARISGAAIDAPYIVMRAIAKVLVEDAVGEYRKKPDLTFSRT